MVRDRLSRFCAGVWNRVEQHRPLAISVAAAGTLALGLTSWVLMDQSKLSSVEMERGR